jgi:hypothetical protein
MNLIRNWDKLGRSHQNVHNVLSNRLGKLEDRNNLLALIQLGETDVSKSEYIVPSLALNSLVLAWCKRMQICDLEKVIDFDLPCFLLN